MNKQLIIAARLRSIGIAGSKEWKAKDRFL
jgi:hypothetical protein